ncbi:peroxidase 40-like [Andrographis paniculata]|uniref:peroxidase 40-like n=1 Tax=Andrographis paniculata TaxID=175694 RepID=UPI0021E7E224|nr:peroxidase 40-like [Andrographis paniculata]
MGSCRHWLLPYSAACCSFCMLILLLQLMFSAANETTTGNYSNNNVIMLSFGLYVDSCPEAEPIVFSWVEKAVSEDPRMAASLLRLHFHDCFVNGCDASVLLDDSENFMGEKSAAPNANSLRGFELIDAIKADLEFLCPTTVSCADILAIAARDSVLLSGGPGWQVQMGRRDSVSASKTAANNNIPGPNSDVPTLLSKFQAAGLSLQDMVALSGAHTMGKARCSTFSARIAAGPPDVNLEFLQSLQQLCSSQADGNATLADLDHVSPTAFDNQYYVNLLSGEGLLGSDQALVAGSDETRAIIEAYAADVGVFFEGFRQAMVRMGSLVQLQEEGQIRTNCRVVNS